MIIKKYTKSNNNQITTFVIPNAADNTSPPMSIFVHKKPIDLFFYTLSF